MSSLPRDDACPSFTDIRIKRAQNEEGVYSPYARPFFSRLFTQISLGQRNRMNWFELREKHFLQHLPSFTPTEKNQKEASLPSIECAREK